MRCDEAFVVWRSGLPYSELRLTLALTGNKAGQYFDGGFAQRALALANRAADLRRRRADRAVILRRLHYAQHTPLPTHVLLAIREI